MSIVAEASATEIPAGTYAIDPVWSALEFEVVKLGLVTIKGRVPDFTGTITGGERPLIEGTVDATSITTFDGDRDGHIQSPDFFDTSRYPELRFASTAIRSEDEELVVEGELTIKGITRPVELRGRYLGTGVDPYGNDRIAIELSGTVDRTDFGLDWNLPLPGGRFLLPNEAVLKAMFAAVRSA